VSVARTLTAQSDAGLISLTGACALLLGVLEARRGDTEEGRRHIKVAAGLARRLGSDRNDYGTEFGPTNVTLHRVAVEVELGNAAEALRLAKVWAAKGPHPSGDQGSWSTWPGPRLKGATSGQLWPL